MKERHSVGGSEAWWSDRVCEAAAVRFDLTDSPTVCRRPRQTLALLTCRKDKKHQVIFFISAVQSKLKLCGTMVFQSEETKRKDGEKFFLLKKIPC